MKKPEIKFYYRGQVERLRNKGPHRRPQYEWRDAFSQTGSPFASVQYPWLTYRECQAQAREQGGRAVFVREGSK